MGCHGNGAFRHSQNKFFPGDNFFGMPGVPLNNWIPMESCTEVARYVKLDHRVPAT